MTANCRKLQTTNYKLLTNNGFTLLEAIIAIGVILTGLVGILVLAGQSGRSIRAANDRIIAAHLAQEAIEVVVAIRDTNWLRRQNWRDNIPATTQGIVDYSSTAVATVVEPASYCLSLVGGVYQHQPPPCNTLFRRHLEIIERSELINGTPVNYVELRAIVEWTQGRIARSITAVDHLYDWR